MEPQIKTSIAEQAENPVVSTENHLGGIGIGRLIDGVCYVNQGNGWYKRRADLPFFTDNGQRYLRKVRSLG